jgi:hypothetical protein
VAVVDLLEVVECRGITSETDRVARVVAPGELLPVRLSSKSDWL